MIWRKKPHRNPVRGWQLISRIYDTVHMVLWSILTAFIIFFFIYTLPHMPRFEAFVHRLEGMPQQHVAQPADNATSPRFSC